MSFATKRTFLVLVILAENPGQSVSRRRLAELVWSNSDERSGRDSLRTALSALRRVLPQAALSSDSEQVSLARGAIELASVPADGEFMPDFTDDWVVERRIQDRAEAVEHFLRCARGAFDGGDTPKAVELVERACARDPLSGEAAALRISILEKQGRRAEA